MKNINTVIDELRTIEDIKNFRTFNKKLKTILDKFDFKFLSKGCYTKVYKSPNFSYVIKVTIVPKNTFATAYKKEYLKPIFISNNKFLAIQNVAITYDALSEEIDVTQKLLDKKKDEEIQKIIYKYKVLQKDKIKPLEIKLDKLSSNLGAKFNYREFPDIHSGNVGYYRNKVYLIDLDNHAKKH